MALHKKLLDVSKLSKMGWSSKIDLGRGLIDTSRNFKEELICGRLKI